jgi:hypothetical protein
MVTSPRTQRVKDADAKSAQGDFLPAISLYETVLDAALCVTAECSFHGG